MGRPVAARATPEGDAADDALASDTEKRGKQIATRRRLKPNTQGLIILCGRLPRQATAVASWICNPSTITRFRPAALAL
jgi:hypothetical protein